MKKKNEEARRFFLLLFDYFMSILNAIQFSWVFYFSIFWLGFVSVLMLAHTNSWTNRLIFIDIIGMPFESVFFSSFSALLYFGFGSQHLSTHTNAWDNRSWERREKCTNSKHALPSNSKQYSRFNDVAFIFCIVPSLIRVNRESNKNFFEYRLLFIVRTNCRSISFSLPSIRMLATA